MKLDQDKIKIKPLPYLRLFLFIFLIINLIGIINFPFYKERLQNEDLIFLLALGLLGFITGTLLIRLFNFKINPVKGRLKPKLFYFAFVVINLASFILIAITHIKNGGILLFLGDKRFATYSYTNIFIYTAIIITLLYFAQTILINKKISKSLIAFLAIQSLSVLSMGYRSPLIILAGSCLLIFIIIRNDFQNKHKNVFTLRNILISLGVIILMSSISSYRVSQISDVRLFFKNMNLEYIDDHIILKSIMPTLAVFRYDQEIVIKLISKTKNAPLKGKLALSNFITILPGEQLGVRNIIGDIVDARKFPDGKPWSITPTLQGALFVDGGYIAVFFGFLLLSACIEYIKKLMVKRKDPFSIVIYALFAINSLMLIHTGYFDLIFFLLIFVIYCLKFIIMRIRYVNKDQ